MTKRTDSTKEEGGDGAPLPPPPVAKDNLHFYANNKVYKSGSLLLSSKGIGWTSWKKRWFILTSTSLVFFRSDPNVIPVKGGEVNTSLGGIDLNNSGSVVVKEDKKLLTVLFADGRDARTFTVKAETLENLHEWKTALEEALADAPCAAPDIGQNGNIKNDQTNGADASSEQTKDRLPAKSLVIGRPILLALEEIDGSPSFLEKALRFVEEHGVKVEGILRQAADVDDVEHRIHEYEQGKNEFSPVEDAHIIADCVKYVLRELPSSPVPASCCNALLDAYRTRCSTRVSAMCTAICETFPEPNRRLLQRILLMMQSVVSHNAQTRMSTSGVAACMAPLLLRPLLAGDCELGGNFDMVTDGSAQLLQAAAAANLAQAIIITLMDEYDKIFGGGSMSADMYSESEGSGSDSNEFTDDDEDYTTEGSDVDIDDDDEAEDESYANSSESDETRDSTTLQRSQQLNSSREHPKGDDAGDDGQTITENSRTKVELQNDTVQPSTTGAVNVPKNAESSTFNKSNTSKGSVSDDKQTTGKKNLLMESTDHRLEEEEDIQKLEATKTDLQNKITLQSKENLRLQDEVERRKNTLQERRLALENEVTKLQEQLEKEKEVTTALESGRKTSNAVSSAMDKKVKADFDKIAQAEAVIARLKQRAYGLGRQINQQSEHNSSLRDDVAGQHPLKSDHFSSDKSNMDNDDDKKKESVTLNDENALQNQQKDQSQNKKSDRLSPSTSVQEGLDRPDSVNTTGSSKTDGTNSTSSALSKLSSRLKFLKERQTQLRNELQKGMDINQNQNQNQIPLIEKPQETLKTGEQSVQNVDKSQVCEWKPPQVLNKGSTTKKQSVLSTESHPKKQSVLSTESHPDKETKPEGQQYLDKEMAKSGGPPSDKGGATTKTNKS